MNLQSTEVKSHIQIIRFEYHSLVQTFQYTTHKGFAEDLSEGKFSFPVVHSIHADQSNRQVMSSFVSLFTEWDT